MEIQTFEIEEQLGGTTPEVEQEAKDLIEKLGLDGQRQLITPESGERFQYPRMTKVEAVVYKAVFPEATKLSEYSHGIIPVRILQVAAHAREYLDHLEVWHKRVPDPDPLLVGRKGSEYSGTLYVLARWGEALVSFQELVKEAKEVVRVQFTGQLNDQIEKLEGKLKRVDSLVAQRLTGEDVSLLY